MRDDERVFLMGEDVGHFGGPFGVSKGLLDEFGAERVIDTPIAEEGFVGAAFGAAWMGERPIAELQFADFISCAFDPIVTVGAKTHWRSGIKLPRGHPLALRRRRARRAVPRELPGGLLHRHGRAQGRVPGERRGRLRPAAQRDRGRRPRALLRAQGALPPPARGGAGDVAAHADRPRAASPAAGSDVTVVAYGAMVDVALRAADALEDEASVEVLDLRTVWPLDGERDPRVARAHLARLRAAGGELVDRRGGRSALAGRRGRASSCSTRRPCWWPRRSRRCRSPPSSRTPTSPRWSASSRS